MTSDAHAKIFSTIVCLYFPACARTDSTLKTISSICEKKGGGEFQPPKPFPSGSTPVRVF